MVVAPAPALAQECQIGPRPQEKGPLVFLNYDQVELDAANDQRFYAPLAQQIIKRYASGSEAARRRLGQPLRESYGPSATEKLDIYKPNRADAPIFVFLHVRRWLVGESHKDRFA